MLAITTLSLSVLLKKATSRGFTETKWPLLCRSYCVCKFVQLFEKHIFWLKLNII